MIVGIIYLIGFLIAFIVAFRIDRENDITVGTILRNLALASFSWVVVISIIIAYIAASGICDKVIWRRKKKSSNVENH